ncbi:MAG: terminase small subunit [Candidatus Gastranaerophilales bacterium]|nr:terminase small subunit [Candidatus Gastranaerophilales bacterium]
MKKKLTNIQKKFIKIYIDTLNPTKSAIEAGYCEKNASSVAQMLLDKEDIINEINTLLSSQTKTLNISKAYIVKKLVDIIENSLNDDSFEVDSYESANSSIRHKTNTKIAKKQKDVAIALKALENLCKQLGFSSCNSKFEDKDDNCDETLSPQINIINNLDETKL